MTIQGTIWWDLRSSIFFLWKNGFYTQMVTSPFGENCLHSRVFTSMCPPGYKNKLIRSDCAAFCGRWEGGKNSYLCILNNTALLPWPFVHFLFTVHVITLGHKAEWGKKKWRWMLMCSCDESVLTIIICWAPTVCAVLSYMMGIKLWTHVTL